MIGAHWDTYGMSPGFNDNGSGVAAILEIARILASATCYKVGENIIYILSAKNGKAHPLDFFRSKSGYLGRTFFQFQLGVKS